MRTARRFWNERVECLSEDELRALQVERIRRQLAYGYRRSPYYREKFRGAGALPEDIRTWEDFRGLPIFLTPDEYKAQQAESLRRVGHPFGLILCVAPERVLGVASTSGTTGQPTFYSFTRQDIRVTNEVLARAFWRMGIRPGDAVLHGFGLSMWVAGIPLIRALEAMGARAIPVGAEAGTERFLMMARLTRPSALLCTPSFAEYLVERAPAVAGIEVGDLGIQRIFCAGEPGAGLPEVRRKLQQAWGAKVYDFSGGPWGISCISCDHDDYQGMHLLSEDQALHYDLVDPDTRKPVDITDGAIGAAVFTAFNWQAAPPLKYMNNDLIQVFTRACPCGMPGKRRKILGRVDDMLIVKGINVYPAAVKNLVNAFVPRVTGEIRIVLRERPPRVAPPLEIKVERGDDVDGDDLVRLAAELTQKMQDVLSFTPRLEFVERGSLKRSSLKGKLIEEAYP